MTMSFLNKDAIHYNYSIYKKLQYISKDLLTSLGLADLTYIKFVSNNKRFIISTHREWVKTYVENELYNDAKHNDIWRKYVFQNNKIRYALWESLEETDVMRFAYAHNMYNGFILFNGRELFSFVTKTPTTNNSITYLNNLDFFEKFVAYFKSEAQNIINQGNKINIITSNMDAKKDDENNSIIQTDNPRPPHDQDFKQSKFYLGDKFADKYLTKAEFKSLFYMAKGKTMKETANILNLSARTIETYIANIKYKLGCYSKKQLLETIYKSDLRYLMEATNEI